MTRRRGRNARGWLVDLSQKFSQPSVPLTDNYRSSNGRAGARRGASPDLRRRRRRASSARQCCASEDERARSAASAQEP